LFWLCFSSTISYCQINGLIYNKITSKGIPYATLITNDSLLTVCADTNGIFCIDIEHAKLIKYLAIKSVGYKTRQVFVNEDFLNIALDPIRSEPFKAEHKKETPKGKIKEIGIPKIKLLNPVFGSRAYENTEIALFIENKAKKRGVLQSISFFIAKSGIFNAPFRLRIYKNNKGVVSDELILDDIFLTGYQKNDWNTFDISKYKTDFPEEGCFVAIEWMNISCSKYHYDLDDKAKGLGMTIGLTDSVTDIISYKRYNHKAWEKNGYIFWNGFRLLDYHPMINIDVLF
jgi:hypothetical protein